jgi:hypothetical protein
MKSAVAAWAAALVAALVLAACGGDDGTPPTPTGSVSGRVLAADNSTPLANAKVSLGGTAVQTDAQGRFTLPAVPVTARAVLKAEAAGYGDHFSITEVRAGAASTVMLRLVPSAAPQTFAADAAATLGVAQSAAQVVLPANALVVEGSGAAATGTLTARLTPIDPASDPRSMPGDYSTSTGATLESFGALGVVLTDAAGNRLNLKAGTSATVRIPLATRSANPPATIPLFHFNETTGRWVEEGSATLQGTAPNQYYEGSVSHFSIWNADQVADTIYVHGCLRHANGSPATFASVISEGVDYSGIGFDLTDGEGRFSVPIRKNGRATVRSDEGDGSNIVEVGPSATDITLTQCLVLNDAPVAPQIVVPPSDQAVTAGGFAVFHVSASGTGPLRYQWRHNGTDIPGATYAYLLRGPLTAADAGAYTVVVSNAAGSASASALLSVGAATAPVIVLQPASLTLLDGATARFSVVAAGATAFQWRRNGVDIAGATSATYSFGPVSVSDSGSSFTVRVANAAGSTLSEAAVLTVTTTVVAPTITQAPANARVPAGESAVFSVVASGTAPFSYQWRRNGADIAGATAATYITPPVTAADNGASFSVVVSNVGGSATSAAATLTVGADDTEQKLALLRLLSLAGSLLEAGAAPLELVGDDMKSLPSAAVCPGGGSVSGTLNGATLGAGVTLPPAGTLAASFTQCMTDTEARYQGSSSVAYDFSSFEPANGSATATMTNLRITHSSDFTANGGVSLNIANTVANGDSTYNYTITPGANATLRNEANGLLATFNSGSLQTRYVTVVATERLKSLRNQYSALAFSVAGVPYVAEGFYQLDYNTSGGLPILLGGSGEVRLSSGGSLVGRLFATNEGLFIEVNGTITPF